MSNSVFKELLQSSRNIIKDDSSNRVKGPLDKLVRDVGQISIESDLLASKHEADQPLGNAVHHFLSKSGINTLDLTQKLNSIDANTFQRTTNIVDHDIESYLQRYEEGMILETVAEARKSTRDDFEEAIDRELQFNWRNDQRRILEDWDREQENRLFGADLHTKDMKDQELKYAKTIADLNHHRLLFKDYPLVETLEKLSTSHNSTNTKDTSDKKAWGIISYLAKTKPIATGWARNTTSTGQDISLYETRCRLIDASKNYLEKEFLDYIYDFLRRNAEEIRVGGIPSVQHRITSYMKYMLKTREFGYNALDVGLEYVNEIPIWFYLYLLIRCGKSELALEFALENASIFQQSAPDFPRYLREYLSAPNRIISQETYNAISSEYQIMEYGGTSGSDPYKRLLYKIIGRCELDKIEMDDVPQTAFDFVWLQLNLIREHTDDERFSYERYRLIDLQNTIIEKGHEYFELSETNPWDYFNVLLLSLQFERFRIQVVHIAIVFAYYHLLQIPDEPRTNMVDILIIQHDGSVSLNFARLISQYVRFSFPDNPNDAFQYQYLLSLFSDLSHANNDMMTLCREHLCSYIASANDYKSLIGTQQQPSSVSIEKFKPLFGIENEAQYKSEIIHPVAEIFRQQGKYKDAVSVFALGDDYDTAIETLNVHLDQALYRPQKQQFNRDDVLVSTDGGQRRVEDNSLVQFAKETLDCYQSKQYILPLINHSFLTSCYVLVHLLEATLCYEDHKFQEALQLIRATDVIPLHKDQLKIQSAAAWFDKSEDNIIHKHIPEILLMVMDILYKLWEQYSNPVYTKLNPSKKPVQEIEDAISGLLVFVGLIQMKIPADYVARLNRTDVMLSLNRK
ncbi:NIC-domain-containing protein, partial [Backusella circina FSU 941]